MTRSRLRDASGAVEGPAGLLGPGADVDGSSPAGGCLVDEVSGNVRR